MTDPESSPPPAAEPASPTRRGLWRIVALGVAGGTLGVTLMALALSHWLAAPRPTAGPGATDAATGDTRKIHAVLFYVTDDGSELMPVNREVPYAATAAEQARRLEEAEVAAAPAGFTSPIPAGTVVHAVFLAPRGEIYVDFSGQLVSGHPGGSLNETLTVFALVDAIAVNMPDVTAVQILVDGHAVDSLAGHLDLRHPLTRSLRWVRKGQ